MSEKQKVLSIREHRIIKKMELPKLGNFVRDTPTLEAYYCLTEFLNIVQGMGRTYYLVINERFAVCMSPYPWLINQNRLKELTNQDNVADQSFNLTRNQADLQQHKSRFYDFMGIAAMGAVVAVVIIALLAMKGKINLGTLWGG